MTAVGFIGESQVEMGLPQKRTPDTGCIGHGGRFNVD